MPPGLPWPTCIYRKHPAKALSEFKICEKLDAGSAKLYYKMGSAAFRSAEKNEADDYFQKSLKLDSTYAPAIMGRGKHFLIERTTIRPLPCLPRFGP